MAEYIGIFGSYGWVALGTIAVVIVLILLLRLYGDRYTKVGPNQVLIVSGLRHRTTEGQDVGFRLLKGGGTFVWPIFEKAELLSLELLTLDVRLKEVYTITGVSINVDGVAQVKIKGEDRSIRTAAERFLGKTEEQIKSIALQTVEGHLRAIVGTLSVEDIYKNRDVFAQKVQEVSAGDLANMGLAIDSFTVRDIKDDHGYLDALGKPRVAQVKRDAIIAQAEADRDSMIRSSQASQAGQEAKFLADTKIAEANQNFEVSKASYQMNINQRKAEADLAYDLQRYKTNQAVKAEEIQVTVIEKERMITVQEREITRRQKELEATISKPADAEKYRIETLANAEKYKTMTEAEGRANALKNIGIGEAEATRAKGLAQANVIQATGLSEAEAMAKKAESWKAYNQAAVTQLIIEKLPELARAIAEPLAKTEKIIVISQGGDSAGASKITQDVTNVIAQLPPVVEALTGMKLEDLVGKLPKLGGEAKKTEGK
ncbi:MAG: flotillin family protein [Deltaproteobacteria bacterium]|nr:flotillin family protein [Deltaproteobacteria bacterium]